MRRKWPSFLKALYKDRLQAEIPLRKAISLKDFCRCQRSCFARAIKRCCIGVLRFGFLPLCFWVVYGFWREFDRFCEDTKGGTNSSVIPTSILREGISNITLMVGETGAWISKNGVLNFWWMVTTLAYKARHYNFRIQDTRPPAVVLYYLAILVASVDLKYAVYG